MAEKPSTRDIERWTAHVRLLEALAACYALGDGEFDVGLTDSIVQGSLEPSDLPGHYRLTEKGRAIVEAMKQPPASGGRS